MRSELRPMQLYCIIALHYDNTDYSLMDVMSEQNRNTSV